jgi:hydroxyethylthiazole kinase-like uncharacterized protein yjeF
MKLISVAEMQAVERQADASGLTYALMMENAGRGVAEEVVRAYDCYDEQGVYARVGALVGPGNNGGDALVALAFLAQHGWRTSACIVRSRPADDPLVGCLLQAGGELVQLDALEGWLQGFRREDVLLDGVLGTGVRLPLKPELAEVLGLVQRTLAGMPRSPHVVAVDCPSGVDCDSGEAAPECFPAEMTVTMGAVKRGLVSFPAFGLVGELRLAGIGPLDDLPAWQAVHRWVADAEMVRAILPPRPLDAHKGTFGTLLVVAGSLSYTGAALLAGKAAYRSGVGWVTMAVPAALHTALAGHFPEAPWLLLPDDKGVVAARAAEVVRKNIGKSTAMLVGCGLGLEETTAQFLDRLFPAASLGNLPPVVIDADGLKLLTRLADWPFRLPAPAVLTPHPGEMAMLTGLEVEGIQAERVEVAERFAHEWGHVVVLKGAFTVIASPDRRTTIIPVATPALARAGTGDVLAGVIAGLRAQGVEAFDAAVAGAWIHARAGIRAAARLGSTASVLAGDVLDCVTGVMAGLGAALMMGPDRI